MKYRNIWHRIAEAIKDMAFIWANEMKMTVKDEGVLIFFIIVPLFYPLLYSWIYNNEVVRDVPVVVVDKSRTAESRQFIRMCNASPDVEVAYYCKNLDEAQRMVGLQKANGVIYFPSDFAEKLNRGDQSVVSVYCDMSLMLMYKAIYSTTQGVASEMNSKIQITHTNNYTSKDEQITTKPLDFDEVQMFNSTGGYGNAILPGVLIVIIQQTLLLGIGLAAGTAREENRYGYLVPISRHYNGIFRIVGGKSLCYFMVFAVISAYLTLVVPRLFGFTAMASGKALVGLMVPYILACIFFGMTLSCLIRYRENVMLIVVFTSLIFLFMTGISWPKNNIPAFWQGVSWLFPSTFGVRGFLCISSMGGTLYDIKPEYQALWLQVIGYFLTTCAVYQVQINRVLKHVENFGHRKG